MKTEREIKNQISLLKNEKKSSRRDCIDKENIQDEINTLEWVLNA